MTKHAQRKERKSTRKIRQLVLISIIVAVFALGATAAVSLRESKSKTSTPQTSSAQTSDARANLRSQIPLNLQTGQVRPLTQEEAQRLAAELKQLVNQSTDGLQSVQHADGSVSIDLQGRFQNVAVAKLDEDGKLVQSCVNNLESAAAFFEIDPQLVGIKKSASVPKINNAALKGRDR